MPAGDAEAVHEQRLGQAAAAPVAPGGHPGDEAGVTGQNAVHAADGRAPSTVGAEDGQTPTVRGVLQNRADGGSTPVEGATVTVTTGGAEVEATSDAQGRFEAEIPFVNPPPPGGGA